MGMLCCKLNINKSRSPQVVKFAQLQTDRVTFQLQPDLWVAGEVSLMFYLFKPRLLSV